LKLRANANVESFLHVFINFELLFHGLVSKVLFFKVLVDLANKKLLFYEFDHSFAVLPRVQGLLNHIIVRVLVVAIAVDIILVHHLRLAIIHSRLTFYHRCSGFLRI